MCVVHILRSRYNTYTYILFIHFLSQGHYLWIPITSKICWIKFSFSVNTINCQCFLSSFFLIFYLQECGYFKISKNNVETQCADCRGTSYCMLLFLRVPRSYLSSAGCKFPFLRVECRNKKFNIYWSLKMNWSTLLRYRQVFLSYLIFDVVESENGGFNEEHSRHVY